MKARKEKGLQPPWVKADNGFRSNIPAECFPGARIRLIKQAQLEYQLPKEIANKKKSRHPKLKNLTVFWDESGILRVRGRINRSEADMDTKNPMVLPGSHPITALIIDDIHVKSAHTGKEAVFNTLRQKYWITGGRNAVRRCFAQCLICRIGRAKPIIPAMGQLPSYRLAANKPVFHHAGVDFCGPLEITVGRHQEKRWIALFTCLVTRAVYLDIAAGLGGEDMLHVFSRFVDSHGLPSRIFSDNGTNFIAVEKVLREKIPELRW